MNKATKPELLLPAGDLEKLKFAFQYGADAVYAGVPVFSLRARENMFSITSAKEAVDYAKSLGKKIYLTLNIFPHNNKIPALQKALRPLADLKPDAFIVADPGVIMLCKEIAPQIPIHLSVQQNNVNWASAKFWHQQGIERVILSREISLKEIREIHEKNPTLELEFFVHGSICMAYSGRCLLSNYMTYRDANQGTCAQSCRWKYKLYKATHATAAHENGTAESRGLKQLDNEYYLEEQERPGQYMQLQEDEHGAYIMNSRDMCLIEYLKDLYDAGICSFKVEGRNKTFYYAATVAKTYRKAIDEMMAGKPFNPAHIEELAKTSNRGFIPGFLIDNPREKAQEYEKRISTQTHEFAGVIRAIHETNGKKLYEMEVKGRLDAPCKVEIMTPDDQFEHEIPSFISTKNGGERTARARRRAPQSEANQALQTTKTVHPGQAANVLIELPKNVPVGAIIRKERALITSVGPGRT
jgi:U32 family peptidase